MLETKVEIMDNERKGSEGMGERGVSVGLEEFSWTSTNFVNTGLHQQKRCWLRTDRHCVQMQEIHPEHPVRPSRPQITPAQLLHPSPLGTIQLASCPPSAPGWSISHPDLPKNTKVSVGKHRQSLRVHYIWCLYLFLYFLVVCY